WQGDPRWLTYKQAAAEGAQVRGGSRGTRIEYWKFRDEQVKRDETGAPVLDAQGQPVKIQVELDRPRRFTAVVFNAAQIDGLPPLPARVLQPEPARHDRAEAILSNSHAAIRHVPGDRAYYSPATDSIILPERQQFKGPDAYYATALHELGHWTGHASRLDRDLAHPFGSAGYAREELRAEIASLMLGEQLEIGHDPGQHAAYVKSWIKVLQDDPAEIFRAASAAEKINTYVMSFEHERALEEDRTETLTSAASNEKFASRAAMGGPETGATSEPMTTERTYLAVPYSEKDRAKRLGAKWDKVAKSWYAPEGTQLQESGLAQWLPRPESMTKTPEVARPQELFADALRAHGLVLEGEPVMDGRLYRVPVEGDRGAERSGAYVGHLDGTVPAGFVQNYKTGAAENWRYPADAVAPLTEEERAEVRASAAATRQRREAQRQEAQDKARTAARALWVDAPGAPDDNAYCVKKSIANPAIKRLRVVPDAASAGAQEIGIRIANSGPEAKAMRAAEPEAWVFNKGDLLVPLYGAE
ncbi:MAG: DUF1738 domain-containing protein, partial [Paracoccaceae bacterium]|nr:DUF1738 domain-containing protein [Paracoccaceae bacterium]